MRFMGQTYWCKELMMTRGGTMLLSQQLQNPSPPGMFTKTLPQNKNQWDVKTFSDDTWYMTKLQELLSTKSPRWLLSIFSLSASQWPYAWPLGRAMEGHQKPSFCLWALDDCSSKANPFWTLKYFWRIIMRARVLLRTRLLHFVIASTSKALSFGYQSNW